MSNLTIWKWMYKVHKFYLLTTCMSKISPVKKYICTSVENSPSAISGNKKIKCKNIVKLKRACGN